MRIVIETILHSEQRYETLGDWQIQSNSDVLIRVTETADWRSAALVGVHELIEVLLCKNDGVSQQAVDDFDTTHLDSDEPGDEPDAPYRDQHCFATAVERMMCAAMKLPWTQHEKNLEQCVSSL